MQNISTTLSTELLDNGQSVTPYVQAEWVNGRSLRNVKGYSSSDDYVDFVKEQNPVFYARLNESFDAVENMYTGPKPVTHWRMNNASNSSPIDSPPTAYAIQDEVGYNNLLIKGSLGTNFSFGSAGVVQDNLGSLSTSTRFISPVAASAAYGTAVTRDIDNRWSLADNPNFSIECWIKPDSLTVGSNGNFIFYKTSKAYLRDLDNPGTILLTANIPEWTLNIEDSFPRFIIYNSSSTAYSPLINKSNIYLDIKSSISVNTTNWWHIVITFDGKNLAMYINNELAGSNNVVNGNLMDTSSGNLYVGARYFDWQNSSGIDTAYDTAYRGYIDEIAIYNSTLSLSDIKSRWKTGSLNIGSVIRTLNVNHNHIFDYSGNGRNGFVYVPSSPFTGIDFRPSINNAVATPLTGRKDGASAYFSNGTSVINYSPLTSDNTSTGTPVFDGTSKVTVSGWIYVEPVTPASELVQMIAAYGAPDGTNTNFGASGTVSNGGWYLTLRRQPTTGNVTLSGSIYDSTANSPVVSYTNLPQSQWVHFVFSVDSSNRAIIMVNGNTSTIATSSTSSAVMNANAAWKLFIGARESSFGLQKAYLSELSIYNTNADINAWSMAYQSVISSNNFKGINKFYSPLQVINGQKEHTVTWAVLDSLDEQGNVITANGDYYISEREETLTTTDYEYGWWSKVKSDASGNFAVPQKLYLRFDPIYANYIDLYSATKYGRIKSGTIEYQLDGSSSWVSQSFTLTSASTSVAIGATEQIQALRLTITSTQYPNDVARVQEFAPRWTEDISSDVVSFDISKVRENYDSSVPLGATGSNTCNIVLDNTTNYANTDLRYNPENVASDLYGIIGPGIKFTVGYNYATSAGTEYIQQGIFYSDNWSIDSDNMTVSISTRDYSGKMQDTSIVDGYIASDITAGEAIGELATRSGVPLSKLNIDRNYVNTVLRDKPAVFWRLNETSLNTFSHYFNGFNYLYSHPFADLLAGNGSVSGTKKDTSVAARKVLPRTFYDFPANELTFEFWIKCDSSANGKTIFNYSTKANANAFNISISSAAGTVGYLSTTINASSITSNIAINDAIWHHIAVVVSPSAASAASNSVQITYYVDGIASGTGALTNFTAFKPSGQVLIGASMTTGTPHSFNASSIFMGHLREMKIWSSARTRAQILNSMNAPYSRSKFGAYSNNIYKNLIVSSTPVGYWPLDVKLNTLSNSVFIRDISGYDRNGTQTTAGMSNTTGPILNEDSSSALNFITNSYISVSNTAITPFEGTPKTSISTPVSSYDFSIFPNNLTKQAYLSMEFWIKPTSLPATKSTILSKDSATAGQKEWMLSLGTSGELILDIYNRSDVIATTVTSANNILVGSWSHIVCTASGSKIQFFINGKPAGFGFIVSDNYLPSSGSPTAAFRIGTGLSGGSLNNTAIAHVALYQRILSQEEAYNHYVKAGYDIPATTFEDTGKLLCHWPLNQGRFYSYEDIRSVGFAYKFAGRIKANIIPNISKAGNHLYAYTTNTASNPITNTSSYWINTGCMAAKDYVNNKNYLTYRLGIPNSYNERDTANYIGFNVTSPISSEIEKSIKFNNSISTTQNIAYINYMNNIPMALSSTASFSVEMWIKPENVTSKQYLFARENFAASVGAGTWRLFLDTDGKIKFEIFPTAGGTALAITPTGTQGALAINTWTHLTAVFSQQGSNNQVVIYNNGVAYATYSWSASSGPISALEVKTIIGGMGQAATNGFIGSISNIAIYNYALSSAIALNHYTRGKSLYQNIYTDIGAGGDSYWSEMLKVATADIGMFFFDELGNFIYDHGRAYDDTFDTQHAVVQYEINDGNYSGATSNKALISGSQTVEIQTNKVVVKVYPSMTSSVQTTSIWSAEAGTSLAICTLASSLLSTTTDSISLNLTLNPAGLYEPLWPDSGVVKIDNEFIRYSKSTGSTLFNLERGYWGSTPQSHVAGSVVGEAREFNLEWSSQPVFFVKYPFITGSIFDKTVTASGWKFNSINGYIRLYPSANAVPTNKYIVVEGNNPVTKLDNYFHVAGIASVSNQKNKQNIVEVSENYKDNIRKYGEKILEIDNPLIQDAAYARDLAQFLLKKYSLPVPVLEVKTIGLPHLQLGDRIKINTMDRLSIVSGEYWIMSISINFNGGLEQSMTLRKVS